VEEKPTLLIEGPGAGSPAGTHAFIVGVSNYPFADGPKSKRTDRGKQSGIRNLTTAARSASEVAAWLLREYHNPDAPLASVRILLSAAKNETINAEVAALLGGKRARATRNAFTTEFFQFREACKQNPEKNVAIVYVAGHGVQLTKHGAILLLEDFAVDNQDWLYGAVDIVACHDAMNEYRNAWNQLWLSDACRQEPDFARQFENLPGAYKPDEGYGSVVSHPLILAASTRESAFGAKGGYTIFSQALLSALRGDAAEGPRKGICDQWHVSATTLAAYLRRKVNEILAGQEEQNVDVARLGSDMVAHRFNKPPDVDIAVHLNPADMHDHARARLHLDGAARPVRLNRSWPKRYRGEAGLYVLNVDVSSPLTKGVANRILRADPPGCEDVVNVS
jgi:hypothetical protein